MQFEVLQSECQKLEDRLNFFVRFHDAIHAMFEIAVSVNHCAVYIHSSP